METGLRGNYQPGENESATIKEIYKSVHSKTKYVFSGTKTKRVWQGNFY
jgi:hypothetical protein